MTNRFKEAGIWFNSGVNGLIDLTERGKFQFIRTAKPYRSWAESGSEMERFAKLPLAMFFAANSRFYLGMTEAIEGFLHLAARMTGGRKSRLN